MQRLDTIAYRRQHPLDLMILSFGKGQIKSMGVVEIARCSTHRLGIIIQDNTSEQSLDLIGRYRMFGSDLINLGNMLFRRTHPVNELPVVAEQKQTGGVLV